MRRPLAWLLAPILAAAIAACGGGGDDEPPAMRLYVTLQGESCSPVSFSARPGRVLFVVTNPSSANATDFAVKREGHTVGTVRNVLGGLTREMTLELAPGAYETECGSGGGVITVADPTE